MNAFLKKIIKKKSIMWLIICKIGAFTLTSCRRSESIQKDLKKDETQINEEQGENNSVDDEIQERNDICEAIYRKVMQEDWKEAYALLESINFEDRNDIFINKKDDNYRFVLKYVQSEQSWHAYYGEMIDNKRNGKGVLVATSNHQGRGIYFGQWIDDQPTGEGMFFNNDDVMWKGNFVNGLFNGEFSMDLVLNRGEMSVNWDTLNPIYEIMDDYVCSPMLVDKGIAQPINVNNMSEHFIEECINRQSGFELDEMYYYVDDGNSRAYIVQYCEVPNSRAFHIEYGGYEYYLYGIPGYKNRE